MTYNGSDLRDQSWSLDIGMYAAWKSTSIINRSASSRVTGASTNRYLHCLNYHY